ncbi:hypothetical protein ACFQRC_04880 [Enterovirga sp. GCM10030262]|uniref:hypothetical protein n=1 Tax=Enterovirga sp. GCM10030262 TaxID=3273391 RepID=UPI00361D5E32
MRHERIAKREGFTEVDIAAVWPVTAQIAPLPFPDIERPGHDEVFMSAPAAPDVPGTVGIMIVTAYAAMIAALAFTAGGSRDANFMIAISALFIVMFFTVPRIILGMEPKGGIRPSFDHFMEHGMTHIPATAAARRRSFRSCSFRCS